jgi:hypothetical protein
VCSGLERALDSLEQIGPVAEGLLPLHLLLRQKRRQCVLVSS